MVILILFSFIGGIITILSPCILPVLPIVLSSSLTGGKRRPLGIVAGFITSFTFFTLFLSAIVKATGLSPDALRSLAVFILIGFGISLIVPKVQVLMEQLFSRLASFGIQKKRAQQNTSEEGFFSGIPIGMSLGLIWAPCVGPIIASVITLAATSQVNAQAILITLMYSLGTAIPLLAITYGGRSLLQKVPWLLRNTGTIQKVFGVLMIVTALGIYANIDRKFQTYILTTFPSYGTGLTFLEDNDVVRKALDNATTTQDMNDMQGKGLDDVRTQVGGNRQILPILRKAPGFEGQSGSWINADPLTLESLKGKVVLVDFWTYTCINCIRTLPYLRMWYEKYKDDGFVIVGVHTPEFAFEHTLVNVQGAVKDFNLTYPIVQDNEYGIWRDYNNRYWPAKYLIDKDGNIRYTHFGEGDYDETEHAIQELLKETGAQVRDSVQNDVYELGSRTPELYLGHERIQYLASPETITEDARQIFSQPIEIPPNFFAFEGEWTIGAEYASPRKGAKLILSFEAKDVFLVMRMIGEGNANVRVLIDGNEQNAVSVTQDKLYTILTLPQAGRHILTLEFLDNNAQLFAFTFG